MNKAAAFIIVLLLGVIALLSWLLVKPVEAPSVPSTETIQPAPTPRPSSSASPSPAPLHERVTVVSPKPNAAVGKTFAVSGKAPGNWFFEASAPILVKDPEGNKLGQSYVQAQGDWMTTELVNFDGTVTLSGNYTGPATLVLMKDNPSGLPEHDDSLEVPIAIQ